MTTNFVSEDQTTVTASTSNVNFPSSNLKHQFRSKRWRATGCTSENVVFDLQTTEDINSVVILWPKEDGIRLTASAVIKIQASATNVWTSPAVDQTLTIDDTYSIASHYFSADQSYRYWRLIITDATNPWGYIEVGKVWLGKSLAIENAQNGFKFSLEDQSKSVESPYGNVYTDEYPTQASLDFSYNYIDYSTVQILENAFRTNGNRIPVMTILDAEETVFDKDHFVIYGRFKSKFSFNHRHYNFGDVDLKIEEIS